MGKLFTEAKEKLGHGKWATFVMGLPQIGFTGGERMARYLMRIARNPALTNRNNYSVLPKSTKALIELSNAQPEAIETAVKTKKIRPTMTADDVLEFINDPVAYDPDSKVPVPFDPDRAEDWLNGQFSKAIERWRRKLPAWTEMVEQTRVLTKADMQQLFPEARIWVETVCAIPKSYVAYSPGRES